MKIIGTGSALPKKVVTNDMLAGFLDTSDEWIYPRTGIKTRHVITDENLEDLGTEAVRKALEMSGLKAEDIDLFIVSNVVSEYITPGMSCIIGEKLGLKCPMFDINCACPGFVYALDMAETYYKAGKIRNAIVACVEEPTRMASWKDRGTCVLFGDGAGAVVLTEGDNIKGTKLHAEPSKDEIWQFRTLVDTPYITKKEEDVPMQMKGRPAPPHTFDGYVLSYYDSPLNHEATSNQLFIDLLSQSTDYAWFFTPYLMLGDDLMDAMISAAQRGVDVRIIMPGIPDKKLIFRMSRSFYQVLLTGGIKIYEYTPGFVHAKSFVSDDKVATIGTVNLDYRSLFLHFENNSFFYRSSIIAAIKDDFIATQAKCKEVKPYDMKHYSRRWVVDGVLRIFAPLC